MDPTANREETLSLLPELRPWPDGRDTAERLFELVQALDEWLQRGGFLPEWCSARQSAAEHDDVMRTLRDAGYQLPDGVLAEDAPDPSDSPSYSDADW